MHYISPQNILINSDLHTPIRKIQLNVSEREQMRYKQLDWKTANGGQAWVGAAGWKQTGVNKSRAERRTAEDLLNEAILHVDIGMEGLVIIHDPPAFDQKPVAL